MRRCERMRRRVGNEQFMILLLCGGNRCKIKLSFGGRGTQRTLEALDVGEELDDCTATTARVRMNMFITRSTTGCGYTTFTGEARDALQHTATVSTHASDRP